jgi:hypothetical protein
MFLDAGGSSGIAEAVDDGISNCFTNRKDVLCKQYLVRCLVVRVNLRVR